MDFHPFAERFPLIQGDEWEAFKASVRHTKGNEEAVTYRMADGKKQGLDGRNRAIMAPVLDVSFGGLAFRARKAEKWPPCWKAKIFQKDDSEGHPIRLRPLHCAAVGDGGVRVGCAYV